MIVSSLWVVYCFVAAVLPIQLLAQVQQKKAPCWCYCYYLMIVTVPWRASYTKCTIALFPRIYVICIWEKWTWATTRQWVYQCRFTQHSLRGSWFAFVIIIRERETLRFYFAFVVIKYHERRRKDEGKESEIETERARNLHIRCVCVYFAFSCVFVEPYIFVWTTVS